MNVEQRLHAADVLFAAEHVEHLRTPVNREDALRLILQLADEGLAVARLWPSAQHPLDLHAAQLDLDRRSRRLSKHRVKLGTHPANLRDVAEI